MADRKQKYSKPIARSARPVSAHRSAAMRIHRSSCGLSTNSTRPSPMWRRRSSTIDSRSPSPGSAGVSVGGGVDSNGTTADDDRLAPWDDVVTLVAPLGAHVLVLDPLLQEHDAFEQRLRPRRAARHVDVDGDDLVDALGDRVAVPVRAAAVGAAAHRDHVLRLGHLLVEAQDRRRHLVGDRAGDDHQVGLARARRQRDDTEAHHVVAGRREGRAHLDGAAREAPLVHPHRVGAPDVEQLVDRSGQPPAVD